MATNSPFNWAALKEAEAPVYDSEGHELGKIDGGRAGYFKVNVSGGFDYWLPQDEIAQADLEGITLKHSGDELEDRKNDARAESLTETEIEEGTDDLAHSLPLERRYENEAEYLIRPRHP